MRWLLQSKINRSLLLLSLIIVYLFSNFPGRGALEGDQRQIVDLKERSDNWGILVPILYGEWPDGVIPWRSSLILFQLLSLWLGLWLIFRDAYPRSKTQVAVFFLLVWVSSVFSSQLWRDSSLFAFLVLGLGIIRWAAKFQGTNRYILCALATFILLITALFKPAYGFLIGVLSLWIVQQKFSLKNKKYLVLLIIPIIMAFSPYQIEKSLVAKYSLQKSFPEQQPIIFDLATNYCWGSSPRLVSDAKVGLELVAPHGSITRNLCAALHPSFWDTLHSPKMEWALSSPIQRLTSTQENKVNLLKSYWLNAIANSPVDWIQTKLIFLGPTLFASNSFVDSGYVSFGSETLSKLSYSLWKLFTYPVIMLDKLRILSLAFLLLTLVIALTFQSRRIESDRAVRMRNLYFGLIAATFSVTLNLITFVANNGRYMMPFILVSYLLLLRSFFEDKYAADSR